MPQVMVDDNVDSYFMVEHLIRLGRKRIVYLQGPDDIYNAYQRGLGYREAMEKFHLFDPELIVKTGMTFKNGADAIDRLIYNKVEFDAVFAFTDTLAIGAQNRLRALGRRVPEEIFVAGFRVPNYQPSYLRRLLLWSLRWRRWAERRQNW